MSVNVRAPIARPSLASASSAMPPRDRSTLPQCIAETAPQSAAFTVVLANGGRSRVARHPFSKADKLAMQ